MTQSILTDNLESDCKKCLTVFNRSAVFLNTQVVSHLDMYVSHLDMYVSHLDKYVCRCFNLYLYLDDFIRSRTQCSKTPRNSNKPQPLLKPIQTLTATRDS
jgi:hypothetical protein